MVEFEGKKASYSWAANSILKLNRPLSESKDDLRKLRAIGPKTEKIILEIINTGRSTLYENLLTG